MQTKKGGPASEVFLYRLWLLGNGLRILAPFEDDDLARMIDQRCSIYSSKLMQFCLHIGAAATSAARLGLKRPRNKILSA